MSTGRGYGHTRYDTIDKIEMVKTTTKGAYADVPVKPVVIKAMTLMTEEE